ncbi:TVP38/TMEM64 family protein [Peribacillus sp. B-H-3]|uniref:TVP38/TMEM64 family protein n=1 Tax=Peribacillus sp. B-H-3 TaxID=3400420 RepID=UPI003B02E10E
MKYGKYTYSIQKKPLAIRSLSTGGLVFFLVFTGLYLYSLHTGTAKVWLQSIHHLGVFGIILGIIIQTIVNVIPVPGEFVSLFLIEIYGPLAGGFFSWLGGILGAILAYHLSSWIARPLLEPMANSYLAKTDQWLQKRGDFGLLIIRFIPLVPYHFINYSAGILRADKKAFIWTTALGILPYTISVSTLFAGVRHGKWIPFLIGIGLFIFLSILTMVLKRKMDEVPHEQTTIIKRGGVRR